MSATATLEAPAAEPDISGMPPAQKLAALLLILDPEAAANLLKKFDDHELELITAEMAKIKLVSRELQGAILREFSTVAAAAGMARRGGVECTQGLLEKAVGLFKASNMVSRVAPTRAPIAGMNQLAEAEPRQIYSLLRAEQPQTVAFVLSFLPPEKASPVLMMMPTEAREQVVERLATLAPTPIEVIEKVLAVLNQKSGGKQPRALNSTGGLKSAAALLNAMDKNTSKAILTALQERNADLVQTIQQKMFTFEDLAMIDLAGLQMVMREVDTQDLTLSLKGSSEKLQGILLGCISKRAAETVKEEMGMLGAVKPKEIEAAQMRIIEVVRRLESEGQIDLGKGTEGENASAA